MENDYNLTVGRRIREVRESLHLSREKFCEKCDISASFLSDVERGKKSLTAKTIHKICAACGVSADYIILGHETGANKDAVIEMLNVFDDSQMEHIKNILCEISRLNT